MRYSIVDNNNASIFRSSFINQYVDNSTEYYHKYIETPSRFEEGMYYDGYLWDSLRENRKYEHLCSMDMAISYLKQKEEVYVMWDLFSNKRVYDRRKFSLDFPRNTIIKLSGDELSRQLYYEWYEWCANGDLENLLFPDDVYCFDDKMNWCVVLTHETTDGEDDSISNRVCFLYRRTEADK